MPLRSLIADDDPGDNTYARNNPFSNANLLHGGSRVGDIRHIESDNRGQASESNISCHITYS